MKWRFPPLMLLKNYALTQIYTHIQKFEAENRYFEHKYGYPFEAFRAKVEGMENVENFEWEDDLLDWEFAATNLELLKNRA